MGAKTEVTGGGPAIPVATDFANFVSSALKNDGVDRSIISWNPAAQTAYGAASQIGLDPQSKLAMAMRENIARKQSEDIANLRARMTSSGAASFGTPAAVAEARYRAEALPQVEQAIGLLDLQKRQVDLGTLMNLANLDVNLTNNLRSLAGQYAALGTPQAQIVQKPGFLQNALGTITGLAGAALPFVMPGFGGLNVIDKLFGSGIPAAPPFISPNVNLPQFK